MRQTTTGKSVASFRIACSRGRKDANGHDLVDWIPVVVWDGRAEFVCKYFQKGDMIILAGRVQSRTYTDKNGSNRSVLELVANEVDFAGSKSSGGGSNSVPAGGSYNEPTAQYDEIEDEGDLPF
nr:MAG TPA: Single strand binding protein [Caudoviricetes sp.]